MKKRTFGILSLLIGTYLVLCPYASKAQEYNDIGPIPKVTKADHDYLFYPGCPDGDAVVIENGKTQTTTGKSWQRDSGYRENTYKGVVIGEGSTWRPIDNHPKYGKVVDSISIQKDLVIKKNGKLDLGYFLGPENYPDNPWNHSIVFAKNIGTKIIFDRNGWGYERNINVNGMTYLSDGATITTNIGDQSTTYLDMETGDLVKWNKEFNDEEQYYKDWLGEVRLNQPGADGKTRLYIEPYYRPFFGGYMKLQDDGTGNSMSDFEYLDFETENVHPENFWAYRSTPVVRGILPLLGMRVITKYPKENEDPNDSKFYNYKKDIKENLEVKLRNEKFTDDSGLQKWKITTEIIKGDNEDKGTDKTNTYEYIYKKDPTTGNRLLDKDGHPIIEKKILIENSFVQYYFLKWKAERSDMKSLDVYRSIQGQAAMRNAWQIGTAELRQRPKEIRMLPKEIYTEGPWVQYVKGYYDYEGQEAYRLEQNYNGYVIGYDKKTDWHPLGGDTYAGFLLSELKSRVYDDGHIEKKDDTEYRYEPGYYNVKNKSIGAYLSWKNQNGWYMDGVLYTGKIENNSMYIDKGLAKPYTIKKNYYVWTYGAVVNAGKTITVGDWIWIPEVGITWGQMGKANYRQKNGMEYSQSKIQSFILHTGMTLSKNWKNGSVYFSVGINKELKDGGTGEARLVGYKYLASKNSDFWEKKKHFYDKQRIVVDEQKYKMNGIDESWWDIAIGGRWTWAKGSHAWIEWQKSFGNMKKSHWETRLGLSWAVGKSIEKKSDDQIKVSSNVIKKGGEKRNIEVDKRIRDNPYIGHTENLEIAKEENINHTYLPPVIDAKRANEKGTIQITDVSAKQQKETKRNDKTIKSTYLYEPEQVGYDGRMTYRPEDKTYELEKVIVQGRRVEVTPGTVSVIYADEYKGESKTLPELLQKVPGVHITYSGGTGRNTYAQIRGSSPNEVHVYIDGIRQNTGANEAVDLSLIPIELVDKVEVYRGYIPARFAGAPLGGVINVITKHPRQAQSQFSINKRSFVGHRWDVTVSTDLCNGELLINAGGDKYDGHFGYKQYMRVNTGGARKVTFTPDEKNRHRMDNDYDKKHVFLTWIKDSYFAKVNWKRDKISHPEPAAQLGWTPIRGGNPDSESWTKYLNVFRNRRTSVDRFEVTIGQHKETKKWDWDWRLTYWQDKNTAQAAPAVVIVPDPRTGVPMPWPIYQNKDFRDTNYEINGTAIWRPTNSNTIEMLIQHSIETYQKYGGHWDEHWVPAVPGSPYRDNKIKNEIKNRMITNYRMENTHFQLQDTLRLDRSDSFFLSVIGRAHRITLKADKPAENMELGQTDVDPPGWYKNSGMMGKWQYAAAVALRKEQGKNWTFHASYGAYYKPPNLFEMFGDGISIVNRYYGANEFNGHAANLVIDQNYGDFVEKGRTWDIGIDYVKNSDKWNLSGHVTYFNRHSENLQVKVMNERGFSFYRNVAAAHIQGIEWESRGGKGPWELQVALTWQDSLVTKGTKTGIYALNSMAGYGGALSLYTGRPIPNIPTWEGNIRLSYEMTKRIRTFIEVHYTGESFESHKVAGSGEADNYIGATPLTLTKEALWTMNWGISYTKPDIFKLSIGVNDILNKGSRQKVFYDSIPEGKLMGYNIVEFPREGRSYYMSMTYFI